MSSFFLFCFLISVVVVLLILCLSSFTHVIFQYIEEIRPFVGVLGTLLFANTEPSPGVTAAFDQLKLMCNTTPPRGGSKEETSRSDSPKKEVRELGEKGETGEVGEDGEASV